MGLATQENQYLTGRTVLNCGDATAAEIDTEVMRMLKEAYGEAKRLLAENRDAMDQIAEFLIEKETITGKEFMKIFRKVKGIPEPPEEEQHEEKTRMGMRQEPPQAPQILQAPQDQQQAMQNPQVPQNPSNGQPYHGTAGGNGPAAGAGAPQGQAGMPYPGTAGGNGPAAGAEMPQGQENGAPYQNE